jgi:hypothetical protein
VCYNCFNKNYIAVTNSTKCKYFKNISGSVSQKWTNFFQSSFSFYSRKFEIAPKMLLHINIKDIFRSYFVNLPQCIVKLTSQHINLHFTIIFRYSWKSFITLWYYSYVYIKFSALDRAFQINANKRRFSDLYFSLKWNFITLYAFKSIHTCKFTVINFNFLCKTLILICLI